jgi:hypothetical protein
MRSTIPVPHDHGDAPARGRPSIEHTKRTNRSGFVAVCAIDRIWTPTIEQTASSRRRFERLVDSHRTTEENVRALAAQQQGLVSRAQLIGWA